HRLHPPQGPRRPPRRAGEAAHRRQAPRLAGARRRGEGHPPAARRLNGDSHHFPPTLKLSAHAMSLIRPFAGLRPASGRAAEVIAPPYDVLSSDEARARAAGKPWTFLHISKPEIDLPVGIDPYAPQVYAKAAENLGLMLRKGILARDPAPCYYAYRLIMGKHTQTGLVAAASVAEYDVNRVRKHEHTQADKENDRVR